MCISTVQLIGLNPPSHQWIMLPPNVRPPGVICDDDECDVTVPLSVVEWFIHFYKATAALNPIECVVRPGEVVFVPRGWWHTVINVEPFTVAL